MTTPNATPSLPQIVRERIVADGRTLTALAAASGLERATVSRFAAGKIDMTGAPLGKLIAALGGEVRWKKIDKSSRTSRRDTAAEAVGRCTGDAGGV